MHVLHVLVVVDAHDGGDQLVHQGPGHAALSQHVRQRLRGPCQQIQLCQHRTCACVTAAGLVAVMGGFASNAACERPVRTGGGEGAALVLDVVDAHKALQHVGHHRVQVSRAQPVAEQQPDHIDDLARSDGRRAHGRA